MDKGPEFHRESHYDLVQNMKSSLLPFKEVTGRCGFVRRSVRSSLWPIDTAPYPSEDRSANSNACPEAGCLRFDRTELTHARCDERTKLEEDGNGWKESHGNGTH
jgi:hypothetical protein